MAIIIMCEKPLRIAIDSDLFPQYTVTEILPNQFQHYHYFLIV